MIRPLLVASLAAAFGAPFAFAGCADKGQPEMTSRVEPTSSPTPTQAPAPELREPRTALVDPSAMSLRFEGRVDSSVPDAPRFAWPASGFRVAFRGTDLVVVLDDVVFEDDMREPDWLAVYVDDRPPVAVAMRAGRAEYPLASALPRGLHRVRVLKRTESEAGTIRLLGARVTGGAFEPAEGRRARSVMAIGDSITAGYGIDGRDASCHYSAATSDATRAYTFVAAETLHAEYQAIAWSGRGLYRNFDPETPELVPVIYGRTIATEPDSRFEAHLYPVDTIVINAGTNDLSQPRPSRTRFVLAYETLLNRVRTDYPGATIVLVVGPMLADDYPPGSMALTKARSWVRGIVEGRTVAGDTKISYLEMQGALPDEGYGCDFHPSAATHRRMAAMLVEHLASRGH
jgi:lysophospholipase L1-like esterase